MIRVAFVGKGGAGKSSLAGTVARLLARDDRQVLAVDSDPMPGLGYSLGLAVDDRPIPDDVVVEGPDDGPSWVLRPGLDAAAVVERYAASTNDGVRYLHFGNLWSGIWTLQRAQFAWSQVMRELPDDAYDIVGDLPGGTRQPMFGWAKYADAVLLVTEPSAKSLHTARRLLNLQAASWGPTEVMVVANKVRSTDEVDCIAQRLGRLIVATVPYCQTTSDADRAGVAPLDVDARSDFVSGAREVLDAIEATYRSELEVSP